MALYRKKPVVIEAVQWDGDTEAIRAFVNRECKINFALSRGGKPKQVIIPTLEGTHYANLGDWIIRGVKGGYYPCKPDIFEQTYEGVNELAEPETRALFIEGITRHM